MEKFSNRENVLLGYSGQKSFGSPSSSPNLQYKNSDVDFHDVFGGPPRRSLIHERRDSFRENRDSTSFSVEEETLSSRRRWSALGEKPVFGEDGLTRRKYPGEDFFDDIFRGDQSSCSSPRKADRDSFSSTPASRVLSPIRPLPPKVEPFGASSLHAHLSLSAKVAKELDFPVLTSPNSPYRNKDGASNSTGYPSSPTASVSRIPNPLVQGQDNLRNEFRPSYRQSPLCPEISLSLQESSNTAKFAQLDHDSNRKRDVSSSEGHIDNNQFHFSIWACREIPLVMPLSEGHSSSTKERAKSETFSRSKEWGKNESIVSEPGLAAPNSVGMNCKNQDNSSLLYAITRDRADSTQVSEEIIHPRPESEPRSSFQSVVKEVSDSFIPQNAKEVIRPCFGVSDTPPDIDFHGGTKKDITAAAQIEHKPELKPPSSLFYDNSNGKGKEEIAGLAVDKEDGSEGTYISFKKFDKDKKLKTQDEKRKLGSTAVQDSPTNSEDKLIPNKVKGKVKEFVKIFNQDAPSKPISYNETRVQSSRWKDTGTRKAEIEAGASLTRADGKEKMTRVDRNKIFNNAPVTVNEIQNKTEKPQIGTKATNNKIYDASFESINSSAACSESILESFEAICINIDESHCEDLQGNCLVDELSYDQNKKTQPSKHHEETQLLDAKIRKWSSGKEGNIRSLLSTLQYVLWPESGWKPVPLVDIIEGNSVKRAYQKALLCLHPDKLQQKGATSHQKYIAEKVFDILQEAWTHFNSLGSF